MPRKNAFTVPEGYFEELPTAVLLKSSVSKVKKEPLLASKPLWWSIAACSLLLLGIWFVVPNSTSSSDSLLAENEYIYVVDGWSDFLAHHICPIIIEDELFALNIEFMPFWDEFTSEELVALEDFLASNDFLVYNNYDLYY